MRVSMMLTKTELSSYRQPRSQRPISSLHQTWNALTETGTVIEVFDG